MTATTPIDPTVSQLVDLLDENLREMFEERAGQREFSAGFARDHAEALAMLDVIDRHPEALSGVTVFSFDIDGAMHFVVTTDPDRGRGHVETRGGTPRRIDIATAVRQEFGGLAELTGVA